MTLFDIATELQSRFAAASAANVGYELLSRGRTVRDNITSAVSHLKAVQTYRVMIGWKGAIPLDAKAICEAVDRFQEAFAKSGSKVLQQESTAKFEDVLNEQRERIDRWVKSTWSENFTGAQTLLDRVSAGNLHGSSIDRVKAQNRASTIEFVRKKDPVRDLAVLEERLDEEGLTACLARVNKLIEELQEAIAAIDSAQAEMMPEVQVALNRAGSGVGLPLDEVTPELLAKLQSAKVADDLVVVVRRL